MNKPLNAQYNESLTVLLNRIGELETEREKLTPQTTEWMKLNHRIALLKISADNVYAQMNEANRYPELWDGLGQG